MPIKILKKLLAMLCCLAQFALVQLPAYAADPPRKFALLIGIDHYGLRYTKQVPAHEQWSQLDGTGNDIKLLKQELERRGFDVAVLLNEQATNKGILQAFTRQFVDKVVKGRDDIVFFHYSGHGQQIPDNNGAPDEADGYDEALVPYDNKGTKDYSNHIRDDDIGILISQVAPNTPNIVISFDSCHSGTATRGAPSDPKKLRTRGSRPMHPPAEARGNAADGNGAWVPAGEAQGSGYVFMSAVRADQEANEDRDPLSGAPMGAYSLLLVQALHDAGPRTTYRDLMERIGAQIVVRVSDQNPQVEGDADKRLFSGEWSAPSKFFRARPLNADGELPIEAGSLHGLVPGSELDILAVGARSDGEGKQVLARVKIIRVELGVSYAVAAKDGTKLDTKAFEKGAQAQEVLTQVQTNRLRVAVDVAKDRLEPMIKNLGFAELVPTKANAALPTWDMLITTGSDGSVRILRADGSLLPVPRGKNQPMATAVAGDDPQLDVRISQALESQFRRARLMALENSDAGSRMEVAVVAHRVDAIVETLPSGAKRPKITVDHGPIGRDGEAKVKAGQIIQLAVENRSTKPCFFTVLELSADGNISVLYPLPNVPGDNKLTAGEKRTLPFPYRMTPPFGSEFIKVVASEDDVDFRALEFRIRNEGATRGARSPLERLMGEVFSKTRGEPFGYAPEKLWGTDTLRFEIAP
ncbi:MAG: DUF4384 domain-containing protein [Myxococcales bacterium]|nr:DUF4384 domain-containing protein [Myxococcales bacterium]